MGAEGRWTNRDMGFRVCGVKLLPIHEKNEGDETVLKLDRRESMWVLQGSAIEEDQKNSREGS